jgi:hypothetical protein
MEHSEGFKSVASKIKSLEQQLSLCAKTIKDFEQSGKDAEKEIEEHFARCMNSLAARKAVLLGEVAQKLANQRMISSTPFHSFHFLLLSIHPIPIFGLMTIFFICVTERIIEDSRGKLEAAIEMCRHTLKSGAMTYAISPNVADVMWKVELLYFSLSLLLFNEESIVSFCSPCSASFISENNDQAFRFSS